MYEELYKFVDCPMRTIRLEICLWESTKVIFYERGKEWGHFLNKQTIPKLKISTVFS